MPYLLDSDVLIDISRAMPAAIDYVDQLPDPWMIGQVTAMELLVGARDKREVSWLHSFLSSYPTVPLDDATGKRAYQLLMHYANRTDSTFSIHWWRPLRFKRASRSSRGTSGILG